VRFAPVWIDPESQTFPRSLYNILIQISIRRSILQLQPAAYAAFCLLPCLLPVLPVLPAACWLLPMLAAANAACCRLLRWLLAAGCCLCCLLRAACCVLRAGRWQWLLPMLRSACCLLPMLPAACLRCLCKSEPERRRPETRAVSGAVWPNGSEGARAGLPP
jgi:hypothetical protein